MIKRCSKCGIKKSGNKFTNLKTGYKSSWCKQCKVKDTRQWQKRKGKKHASPLTRRIQMIVAHLIHAESPLRSKDIRELLKEQDGRCAYTLIPFQEHPTLKEYPLQMSLDRVNSNKGYTKDNVVLCCLGMNHLKGSHGIDTMYKMLKLFYEGVYNEGISRSLQQK